MKSVRRLLHAPVALASTVFLSNATLGQQFQLLGPGEELTAISDDGSIGAAATNQFAGSASWTWNGGFSVFGHDAGFRRYNQAWSISGDGRAFFGIDSTDSSSTIYRWSGAASYEALGRLPGWQIAQPHDADRTGSTLVGHSESSPGTAGVAWIWTRPGGLRSLGYTRPEGLQSQAWGISADGRAVVGWSSTGSLSDAFIWTAERGMRILETLPSEGVREAEAFAINSNGSMIVGRSRTGPMSMSACVWRDGAVSVLATPEGARNAEAFSLSDDGTVILGAAYDGSFGWHAYVWTPRGGSTLTDYLHAFGVQTPDNLELVGRPGGLRVSADGRTFFGASAAGAFVATIPCPGWIGVGLCLSAPGLAGRRRR